MNALDDLRQSVSDGNASRVETLVRQAIDAGLPAERILNDGLIAAMAEVGQLFQCGEYYVPEMLVAARAMKAALSLLRPQLVATKVQAIGKVIIGTVQGDLHDIGKNLVAMMLAGAGFEIIDLGVDVPPQKFVDVVGQQCPDLIGLSAMLTTTMVNMNAVLQALEQAGLRNQVRVMVGGAPLTENFVHAIGADWYAPDASSAVIRAKSTVERG